MSYFDDAVNRTLKFEGGYVNDPLDRGGATNMGITEGVARAAGYKGDMKDLPKDLAKSIYKKSYWDSLKLDNIAKMLPLAAEEAFDAAVNCGVLRAGKWLQEAFNALSIEKDLAIDGKIGPATIAALSSLKPKDDIHLASLLRILRGHHYLSIVQNNPTQERFIRGWLNRINA